jgi:hypothetical protein
MAENPHTEPQTVDERDQHWLANVYRGDKEKDLTFRAVSAGMLFGGLMSLSLPVSAASATSPRARWTTSKFP